MVFSKSEHALNAVEGFLARRLCDKHFTALPFEAMQNIGKAVHRHPRAVGTTLAGGAIAGGWRFN